MGVVVILLVSVNWFGTRESPVKAATGAVCTVNLVRPFQRTEFCCMHSPFTQNTTVTQQQSVAKLICEERQFAVRNSYGWLCIPSFFFLPTTSALPCVVGARWLWSVRQDRWWGTWTKTRSLQRKGFSGKLVATVGGATAPNKNSWCVVWAKNNE